MTATIHQFPDRGARVVILFGTPQDILVARARQRIAGRWCKVINSSRAGFCDAVAWRDGEVRAQLSRTDGAAGNWYPAAEVEPASKGRVL